MINIYKCVSNIYCWTSLYIVCIITWYYIRFENYKCGISIRPLQWCHNGRNGVSNHRRLNCLLSRLFRRRSKITSKLCITGLCEGNSPVTGEFPAQRASNMENVSIWWRHHAMNSWRTLYLALTDELWSIFCKYSWEESTMLWRVTTVYPYIFRYFLTH